MMATKTETVSDGVDDANGSIGMLSWRLISTS